MFTFDFKTTKKNIRYQIMNSNTNIDTKNDEMLFDYYCMLIRFRHDILHYLTLEYLNSNWTPEISVSNFINNKYNIVDEEQMLQKTPDILITNETILYLIDVSVSMDVHQSEFMKKTKYNPICDYLYAKYKIYTKFIHINVKSGLSNIEKEVSKLLFVKNEFDYPYFTEMQNVVEEKINWVFKFIDKTYFELKKQEKFNIQNMQPQSGRSKDIDIDHPVFEAFNNKYDTMEKIEKIVTNFDEQKFCEEIKNVLENEDDLLYKKYCDNDLNLDQFEQAKQKIHTENEKKKKTDTKTNTSYCCSNV